MNTLMNRGRLSPATNHYKAMKMAMQMRYNKDKYCSKTLQVYYHVSIVYDKSGQLAKFRTAAVVIFHYKYDPWAF